MLRLITSIIECRLICLCVEIGHIFVMMWAAAVLPLLLRLLMCVFMSMCLCVLCVCSVCSSGYRVERSSQLQMHSISLVRTHDMNGMCVRCTCLGCRHCCHCVWVIMFSDLYLCVVVLVCASVFKAIGFGFRANVIGSVAVTP